MACIFMAQDAEGRCGVWLNIGRTWLLLEVRADCNTCAAALITVHGRGILGPAKAIYHNSIKEHHVPKEWSEADIDSYLAWSVVFFKCYGI
ncbi:hypothetical protein HNY73_004444 [Argiope bruennichi]|uniref:Uncharacterized protein n=1 Tax=Argiope bruennichi TaxID=94029 RepID=A0A8T0FP03_ARGBR|nr:hypothetical protein HNY73_004444 [Argiope bruennichi]